jgi:hypothetical protein
MRLERAVYSDAHGGEHDGVTRKGRHHLADGSEPTGALAPSRDIATIVREARYRRGQTVQDDGAAFEGRRVSSDSVEPYR